MGKRSHPWLHVITYSCPNLNGGLNKQPLKVTTWMSNYTTLVYMDVITYVCNNLDAVFYLCWESVYKNIKWLNITVTWYRQTATFVNIISYLTNDKCLRCNFWSIITVPYGILLIACIHTSYNGWEDKLLYPLHEVTVSMVAANLLYAALIAGKGIEKTNVVYEMRQRWIQFQFVSIRQKITIMVISWLRKC